MKTENLGYHEQKNRQIKRNIGLYSEHTVCRALLMLDGVPSLNDIGHPNPLLARSFLEYGESEYTVTSNISKEGKEKVNVKDVLKFMLANIAQMNG